MLRDGGEGSESQFYPFPNLLTSEGTNISAPGPQRQLTARRALVLSSTHLVGADFSL